MIILPDRHAPRSRFLMPVSRSQWMRPSQRSSMFGIENTTMFSVAAHVNDGHVVWRGWFDDRDDVDAFLWALVTGSLRAERALWDLPSKSWSPWIGEDVSYSVTTLVYITSPTGSNQSYTVPADWNSGNNTIDAIGAGGGGGGINTGAGRGSTGGGGGAFSRISNQALTPGGSVTYQIGTGGPGAPANGTGTAGGDTWFNGASLGASSVGAKGGSGGISGSGGTHQAAGGAAASGIGTTKNSGGASGQLTGTGTGSTGGGGAAGPGANGNAGVNLSSGNDGSAGGAGNGGSGGSAGSGGTSGSNNGGSGGDGTEYDSTHGTGGGGGGAFWQIAVSSGVGGNGGRYGGAGGGGNGGGDGHQGVVVVSYDALMAPWSMTESANRSANTFLRKIPMVGY